MFFSMEMRMGKALDEVRTCKSTNVTLPLEVLNRDKEIGINLSRASERAVREEVQKTKARRWVDDNAESVAACTSMVARDGAATCDVQDVLIARLISMVTPTIGHVASRRTCSTCKHACRNPADAHRNSSATSLGSRVLRKAIRAGYLIDRTEQHSRRRTRRYFGTFLLHIRPPYNRLSDISVVGPVGAWSMSICSLIARSRSSKQGVTYLLPRFAWEPFSRP